MKTYILLAIFWISYFALHSFLATNFVKEWAKNINSSLFRYYRIFFNILSASLLVFILNYQFNIKENGLFNFGTFQIILALLFLIAGAYVLLIAFKSFNKNEFFGVEQLYEKNIVNNSQIKPKLITSGWYAFVRHPLYFGVILLMIGFVFFLANWSTIIMTLITFIYLIIGTKLEENKLIETFGDEYKEYQKKVKMLIPFII